MSSPHPLTRVGNQRLKGCAQRAARTMGCNPSRPSRWAPGDRGLYQEIGDETGGYTLNTPFLPARRCGYCLPMAAATNSGRRGTLAGEALPLAPNKTKLVCTIGPASESPVILRQMLQAGMNIARLNFSHGEFAWHRARIAALREAAAATGLRVTILADLPGPKIRIGQLAREPIVLQRGDALALTVEEIPGGPRRVFVNFPRLPAVVRPGDNLFLNDGNIQLEVVEIAGREVACRVLVGGELRSRKGLNLPGIDLGVGAFTEHDRHCLKFALENGVDAISQSFVETAADVDTVRAAAAEWGYQPFIIAKIERAGALAHVGEFSYGVAPMHVTAYPGDWTVFARRWVQRAGLPEDLVVLMEGPSAVDPGANPRREIIDLRAGPPGPAADLAGGRHGNAGGASP